MGAGSSAGAHREAHRWTARCGPLRRAVPGAGCACLAGAMRYTLVGMSTRNIAIAAIVIVVVVVIILFVL